MSVPATSPISGESASWPAVRLPVQTLGQDDFLRLLITQMTAQDPLNPKKDTDFIAQMAQFSALEQTRSMQAELAQLRENQEFLQASDVLGRKVELQLESGTPVTGVVEAIRMEAGTPRIVVSGHAYDLSRLLSVQIVES